MFIINYGVLAILLKVLCDEDLKMGLHLFDRKNFNFAWNFF